MQYINPYLLLGISPHELIESDNVLKKAKRKVLAEIELEGYVTIDEIKIGRADALRAIEDLDYTDKREFHSLIFYDEELRDFLTSGYTDWFFNPQNSSSLKFAPFVDFLVPFYANKFSEVFFAAVINGDTEEVKYMERSPIKLQGEFYNLSRLKVKNYYIQKLNEIQEKADDSEILNIPNQFQSIDYTNKVYNPLSKIHKFLPEKPAFEDFYFQNKDIAILNELSDDFQSLRDKICSCLKRIAVTACNEFEEFEIGEIILEQAGKIKIGSRIRKSIEENLSTIKERLLAENLSTLYQLLTKTLNKAKQKQFPSSIEILQTVEIVVDVRALNALPENKYNNEIIGTAMQLSDIALITADVYTDPSTALRILDKALEFRIKDTRIGTALLQKLNAERYAISLQKDLLNAPRRKQTPRPQTNTSYQNQYNNPGQSSKSTTPPNYNSSTNNKTTAGTTIFASFEEQSKQSSIQPFLNKLKALAGEHTTATSIIICLIIFAGIIVIDQFKRTETASTKNSNNNSQSSKSQTIPPGMVYITGGEFLMGRIDNNSDEVERPSRKVTVKSFLLDIYETTNEEYLEFVKKTNYRLLPHWKNGSYPNGQSKYPVTGVNWEDANAFARWKGKRLPTEMEWEFAARGTNNLRYSWGNDWQRGYANAGGENQTLVEVGKYKSTSPFGVYDMIGNAWEWTASEFKAYPNGKLPDVYKGKSNLKTLRGGSFESKKEYATATYRIGWAATGADNYKSTGFRCAKDLEY